MSGEFGSAPNCLRGWSAEAAAFSVRLFPHFCRRRCASAPPAPHRHRSCQVENEETKLAMAQRTGLVPVMIKMIVVVVVVVGWGKAKRRAEIGGKDLTK